VEKSLRAELVKRKEQDDRPIKLAAEGAMAIDKLRERLEQVSLKKGLIEDKLVQTQKRLTYGVNLVLAYVDMLVNPIELYNRVPDDVRRDLLGATFNELVVHVEDGGLLMESERAEVNDALYTWNAQRQLTGPLDRVAKKETPLAFVRGILFRRPRRFSI